ncbi:helix-turn-helix transcriptional regulator [Pseudomonas sp. NPDC089996]|uniref:helix-turn-helix domain-containing protein n=1 Tax=Pseudomonas sp. NPDC089996 TaxID=3364474 RepID=UPI0037F9B06C
MELFENVSSVGELGIVLEKVAIQLGFKQALLVVEFPTPFSRHRCLMIKGQDPTWVGSIDDDYIAPLRSVLLNCAGSVGLIKWSLECPSFLVSEQSSPQENSFEGIASSFLALDGSLHSVLFFRSIEGKQKISEATLNVKMACVLALTRQAAINMPEERRYVSNMTEREVEILRWTADGKCASEISRILHISENTVIYHIKKLLAKTGCANKLHAVAQAIGHRLL